MSKAVIICGEELILSEHRAVFWPREQMLIVSDLHIGKSAHFRKSGIPIPDDVQHSDLQRLQSLVEEFLPQKLLVVGDMFHHESNGDNEIFKEWRFRFQGLQILLVSGNHDRYQQANCQQFDIQLCRGELDVEPFRFVHEFKDACEMYCISGHVHPGVYLSSTARQSLRLPCFVVNENNIVLPAFSSFTGLDITSAATANTRHFAIGGGKVFEVV